MMRHFLVALLTLTQVSHLAFAGLPPTTTKGQSDANAQTTFNVQVPFNQKTSLGGVTSLLETGNGNMLTDPGFEGGGTSWTASGGTYAITTTAANIGSGAKAASWDSSAAAQTLTSATVTIPAGMYGQNSLVSCKIQGAGATHLIQAYDGTNVVASQTISSFAGYTPSVLNFVAPSSGTLALRIVSVASNEPIIYIDDCTLSLAGNLYPVSQMTEIGTISVTGCAADWTTSSATYANFGTQTGCAYTTTGALSAPATNVPGFRATIGPGVYVAFVTSTFYNAAANVTSLFRMHDGTSGSREENYTQNATGMYNQQGGGSFSFLYTAPQNNITIQMQGQSPSANAIFVSQATAPFFVKFYKIPSVSDTAINSNQNVFPTVQKFTTGSGTYTKPLGVSWIKVKMVGGGGGGAGGGTSAPAGGNGGVSTFGTSLLTANGGVGATQVGGAGGSASIAGAAIGTALSGGSGGGAGYAAVASGWSGGSGAATPFGGSGGGGSGNASAGLAGVANSGSGGGGGGSNDSAATLGGGGGGAGGYVEAIINAPDVSYSYAVGAAGTAGTAGTSGSAGAAGGSGYIEVTEYYGAMNAPIIIGSVTSNSLGAERIERLKITNSTSSASQSGSWASVSNNGTGRASVTITAGMFSATPVCTCTTAAANNAQSMCQITGLTNTSFEARTRDSTTGGLVSEDAYVVCMGPR